MAVFVPNPDQFDVEDFIEQLSIELSARYRDAEDELIQQIAIRAYRDLELQQLADDTIVRGGLTAAARRNQNRALAELAAHRAQSIRELNFLAAAIVERLRLLGMAEEVVRVATEEGEAAAAARLALARNLPATSVGGFTPLGGSVATTVTTLTGTAVQATAALAMSLQSRLEVLNQRITRYPQDAYQRIVSLTTPNTLLGITTSLQQQQATVRRFLNEGVTGFVDVSGRKWRIGSYAEMAGRTAVNRAFNDAGIWRMQQVGVNLVVIVGGFDACKRCAPWIGKILSTDGSPAGARIMPHATLDEGVAVFVAGSIDEARNAGWNHPNCRDRAVAYLAGLSVPQADFKYNEQADKERAQQRSLERDIRAAKRDVATAPDEVSRQRAERDVAEAQQAMRDFLDQTGRTRQSYREQLHFADGK